MSFFVNEQFASSYEDGELHQWVHKHWPKTILISAIYFVVVFAGKHWMTKREKFSLRWALTLWSASLAVFSILGSWVTWSRLLSDLRAHGLNHAFCDDAYYSSPWVSLWLYWFSLSKIVELGDTIFIVARKQKLIFLHWYHHIATLVYTWYGFGTGMSTALCFASMNFAVHSLMYSYYALRASKLVRMPRGVNVAITSLQLLQMISGMFANVYAYREYTNGRQCAATWYNVASGLAMYTSYAVLFASFFWQSYLGSSKPKSDAKLKGP